MSLHEQESSSIRKCLLQSLGKSERLNNQTSEAEICKLDSRDRWMLLFTALFVAGKHPLQ